MMTPHMHGSEYLLSCNQDKREHTTECVVHKKKKFSFPLPHQCEVIFQKKPFSLLGQFHHVECCSDEDS